MGLGIGAALLGGSVVSALGSYLGGRNQDRANRSMAAGNMEFQDQQRIKAQAYDSEERIASQDWNEYSRSEVQDYQERLINTARSYDERMSNTSFQRGVSDMKHAGINPILAFMKGGASTPSAKAAASSAGQSVPGKSKPGRGAQAQMVNRLAGMAPSAIAMAKGAAEISNIKAQTKVTKKTGQQVDARTEDIKANSFWKKKAIGAFEGFKGSSAGKVWEWLKSKENFNNRNQHLRR